jgi:toxin-antitoxin system PIN domain toxin
VVRYLPDANVLIFCLNKRAPEHAACWQWLEEVAEAGDSLALCEIVEVALLRIGTLPAIKIGPVDAVLKFWLELTRYPETIRVSAGSRHEDIFLTLIRAHHLAGNDINDAWIAALAIEHEATLVSTDRGFGRFPGLSWVNPYAES